MINGGCFVNYREFDRKGFEEACKIGNHPFNQNVTKYYYEIINQLKNK